MRRLQTIVGVLTHHGFGHLVDSLQLHRYVPLPKRWRRGKPSGAMLEAGPDANLGRRIARVCEDLGPTFVKLGQILSTRPDLVPPDVINELVKLQDKVPPFPSDEARQIIASDLGSPVEECFAEFAAEPFASGSIAQVYRARTKPDGQTPGQSVVVKVKRPGIEDTVRLDMSILRWISEVAERFSPELMVLKPRMIVEEFERTMLRELDFINEAATIGHFGDAMGRDPHFRIPVIHWELTGPSVLTLEEIHGVSLQKLLAQDIPEVDRKKLAERIATGFLKQYFEMGFFHGDPHPGNILIQPPATVGLIDFGLTGRMDDAMIGHLVMALFGALNKEPEIIVEVLADMNLLGDDTDRARLRREFLQLIEKYYGLPLYRFDMQVQFFEIMDLVRRNNVVLPREFVLFGKSLVAVGGICMQLDPELDQIALIKPRLFRLLAERLAPARLLKSAAISGWHVMNLLRSLPSQLRDVARRMSRGRWQVNIRHQNLDSLGNEIDRASNRLGFAVIIAAVIIGSSWILTNGDGTLAGTISLQTLGVIGYVVAGVMGVWLAVAILRSGKLS